MKKILYTIGASFFVAAFLFLAGSVNSVSAAVQNSTSTVLQLNPLVTTTSTFPVLQIAMNNTGTTLSSTVITVATTTQSESPTALSSSSFDWAALYFDADSNGQFDASDTLVGTSTVNINSSTTITPSSTINAVGTFFVVLKTSGAFTDNGSPVTGTSTAEQFTVSIGTSSITTSGGVSTTTPTSTPNFTADTHSEAPATSSISASWNGGAYTLSSQGGAEEQGTLNIYSSSSATSTIATSSVGSNGSFSPVSIGNQYLSSVWVSGVDALNNPESARVQYSLPAQPTFTSVKVFTDRIIANASANLNGQEAMTCSNYQINGSDINCSGPGNAYINFNGNQITIMGLNLTSGASVAFSASGIQDITQDQFPVNYSNSGLTVQSSPVPSIASISPGSGAASATVTITGSNFGSATGTLMFSGGMSQSTGPLPPVSATVTSWGGSSITATVPAGAQTGPVMVINSSGMTSNVTPNTVFYVLGDVYVELYSGSTSTPITTSTNMKIFIGGPLGMSTYYVGDGSTAFNSNVYTISSVPTMGFAWAYDASGTDLPAPGQQFNNTSSTSPLQLILPGAAAGKVTGTLNLGSTYGANKMVAVMATPQGMQVNMGPGGVQPQFFTTNGSGSATYSVPVPANGTYNVQTALPPSTSTTPLINPSGQNATISNSTTTVTLNFTYSTAARQIYGQVVGANGNPISDPSVYQNMWITAYQPNSAGSGASVAQPDSQGHFTVYANDGVYKIDVGGQSVPSTVEKDVTVTDASSFDVGSTTTVVTIVLQPPTSYISGSIKDGSGNGISGADVNAFCTNGPGNGHATTDNQGSYKMYVPPCSDYDVTGFAPNYGKLPDQTGVSVSASGNGTVNFTLSNSNFVNVSGILEQNSSAAQGANIWITQGDQGMGVGGGGTDQNGHFSISLQKGLSNLYLHAALNGQGQIVDQALASPLNASTSVGTINVQTATLTIQLEPGNTFTNVSLGAKSSIGGGYANTPATVGTTSTYDTYNITVPYSGSTTYTIGGGIPGVGMIPATTTAVSGNTTVTINLANNFYTVSGTVNANYGTGAYVWANGTNGGGGVQVSTSTGAFSLQLQPGTYDIGVNKPGYIGSVISGLSVNAATSGLSLALTASTATISGTVEYNGTAVANARVWATSPSGGWNGGSSDANGNFTLNVGSGSYTLNAITNGYNGVPQVVASGASGVVLNMTSVSFTPTQQTQSVSPSQGGILQTTSTTLSLPQGALGTGSTDVQLSIANTMNTPDTKGMKVVGTGEDISASYSSGSTEGQAVSTLSSDATIQMVLTKSQLTSEGVTNLSQAEKIVVGYYDATANSWVNLPTTVVLSPLGATWDNLSSITYSGTTDHFSTYAPVLPTSGTAPSTPSSVAVGVASVTSLQIEWPAVSGAATYNVYRKNGSNYPYVGQTANTYYVDTGLTTGTTYYYKVTAVDSSNNESAASAVVSDTPASTASVSIGGGGGGSGTSATTSVAPTTTTSASTTATTTATVTSTAQTSSSSATGNTSVAGQSSNQTPSQTPVSAKARFTELLKIGSTGESVTALQQILISGGYLKMPKGVAYGYFGQLTRKAVEAYQAAHGIEQIGIVGPETRAQLNAGTSPTTSITPSSAAVPANFARNLTVGSTGTDVTALQQVLVDQGYLKMPKGVAYGYFGQLTKEALAAWQKANNVTPSVGYFGPKSRAKITE